MMDSDILSDRLSVCLQDPFESEELSRMRRSGHLYWRVVS